ncbi:MAG TPA: response regulator [Gemmatimonadaceae bacterium]|jgi:DNA-binding NtrC family response regulator|nr:response regulator [Gemmatimonadaceae bacterium]
MTKRVLIVDDDRQMVRTLSDVVQLHGWEAHGAYSGEEAITSIQAHPFTIVLMDVRMEGASGVDALRAMKRIRPGIRVILMTAHTASDVIAAAEREGALHVLRKPVPLPELVEMLDAVVA